MTGISAQLRDGVLHVVLDRPEKLNAVNTPMLQELAARVRDGNQETVRAVLITGAGRAFCSGGDLSGKDTDGAAGAANDAVRSIVDLPKPVIAGVHGPASGFGCSLALACDLIIAARSAYFQLAFANVGLMPDGGASALIPASIGRQRAARMALLNWRRSSIRWRTDPPSRISGSSERCWTPHCPNSTRRKPLNWTARTLSFKPPISARP
jgi:enoyl-CoA hydratase/carnithine racemase